MENRCYKRTLTLTIIHQVDGVDRDIIAQSVNTGARKTDVRVFKAKRFMVQGRRLLG